MPETDDGAAHAGHVPVLLGQAVALLAPAPGRRFLDCTLGLGGHSAALLAAGAAVVGIDRDPQARARACERLEAAGDRLEVRSGTFAAAARDCAARGERFHGVLADLGVSSLQLDDHARGFSIRSQSALDLRMGDGCAEDALALIDRLDRGSLARLLRELGEEPNAGRVASAILRARAAGRLATAADLAGVVRSAVRGSFGRHPAMRTFQALRIAVNGELDELDELLALLPKLLLPGGMAVIISFHSLEDRRVKESFRAGLTAGTWQAAAKRVVTAELDELARNPRAQAAKLRWARRPERGEDQP